MESRFEIFVTINDTVVALKDIPNQVTSEYFGDLQDALDKSVKIKFDGHEIPYIFKNAIHALQVWGHKMKNTFLMLNTFIFVWKLCY